MPANWLGFAGAIVLGVASFAGMGLARRIADPIGRGRLGGRQRRHPADGVPVRLLRADADFPAVLQAIADVLPLTYFIDIVNGVYLDGDSLFADPKALAIMLAWGARRRRRRAPPLRLDAARALAVAEQREEVEELRDRGERAGDVRPGGRVQRAPRRPSPSFEATSPRSLSCRFARFDASNSTGSVTNWKRTATA